MNINLIQFLEEWLERGGSRIGQVSIRAGADEWSLMHTADRAEEPETLEIFSKPEAARGIALKDEAGEYRPLKSAPNLKRGWELRLPDVAAVRLALDFLYPAALGNWVRWREGGVPPRFLREDMLNRQTGMYKVTSLARDEELLAAIGETCEPHQKCLRKIVWALSKEQKTRDVPLHLPLPPEKFTLPSAHDPQGAEMPVLCTDACPLLIGAIRETVSRRRRAEREAAASASPQVSSSHSHA